MEQLLADWQAAEAHFRQIDALVGRHPPAELKAVWFEAADAEFQAYQKLTEETWTEIQSAL